MFNFLKCKKAQTSSKASVAVPLTKHYVFNETGNIMLCTTRTGAEKLVDESLQMFSEVSVFFSALAKAITESRDENGRPLTIYNYDALKRVLNASGMFMEVNQDLLEFSSKNVGSAIQKEMIQTVLGRGFGEDKLNFASGLIKSMGKQAQERDNKQTQDRAGSIFFICEVLLGMPTVSVILVKLESDVSTEQNHDAKASLLELIDVDHATHNNKGKYRSWTLKKRTYLFMPPKMIRKHIGDLVGADDQSFHALVERLKESL